MSRLYALLLLVFLAPTPFVSASPSLSTPAVPNERETKPKAPPQAVTLPVEVFPPNGADEYVVRTVVDARSQGAVLYLQGHALGYDKSKIGARRGYDSKASVRVNDGPWRALSNASARVLQPEKRFGGIGGAFHTVRLELDVSGFQRGANTIAFRFNGTEGISNGYRIVDLDVRTAGGASVLRRGALAEEDPSTWTAPAGFRDAASVEEGRRLWNAAVPRESPLQGGALEASCADCHAEDGRDLKYFNFSNASIVSRSRFHGLTADEGKQIAAYIRDVDLELPAGYDVSDAGRPWNPPYQPGPGLEDKPVELWAAGAGIDAVLERDEDMMPYLREEYREGRMDARSAIEVIDMPQPFQFPDWNEWLPDVHPFDQYSKGRWESTENFREYEDLKDKLEGGQKQRLVEEAARGVQNDRRRGLIKEFSEMRFDFAEGPFGFPSQTNKEKHGYGMHIHQWMSVKFWELHQKHKLEDLGEEIYGGTPYYFRDRVQIHPNNVVWFMAPHMLQSAKEVQYPGVGPFQSMLKNHEMSMAWYQVQMTLAGNSMDPQFNGTPIIYGYHFPHISNSGQITGRSRLAQFTHSQIVVLQSALIEGEDLGAKNHRGVSQASFQWKRVLPTRIFRTETSDWGFQIDNYDPALRSELLSMSWKSVIDEMQRHDASEWPRNEKRVTIGACRSAPNGNRDGRCGDFFAPADYTPQDGSHVRQRYQSDNVWRSIDRMRQYGMHENVISQTLSWADTIWPRGNWEARHRGGDPNGGFELPGGGDLPPGDLPGGDDSETNDPPSTENTFERVADLRVAETGDGYVTYEWTAPEGAVQIAIKDHGRPIGDDARVERHVPASQTRYTDDGRTNGEARYLRVKAVYPGGASEWSDQASGTPGVPEEEPLAPVADLRVAETGDGFVTYEWTAPEGAVQIAIIDSSRPIGDDPEAERAVPASQTRYTDDGRANGEPRYLRVKAVYADGESAWSDQIIGTPEAPEEEPLAPVADLRVAETGDGFVTYEWTAPEGAVQIAIKDHGRPISDDARIERHVPASQTRYTDDGRTNGEPRYLRVKAVYPDGASEWSDEASGTPGEPEEEVFAPVADLRVAETGDGFVTYEWTAPEGAEQIAIKDGPSPIGGDAEVERHVPAGQTRYTDDGRTNGEPRYLRVKAVYADGASEWSDEASGTPGVPSEDDDSSEDDSAEDDPPVADGPAVVDPDGDGPLLAAINAGGPAYESTDGTAYQADAGYTSGSTSGSGDPISETEDDVLYGTERYGNFTYALPVPGPGTYDLTLMFSEIYWEEAGRRRFSVHAGSEGALQTVVADLDLWAEFGHDAAYVLETSATTTDDTLRVTVETLANNGKISALALSEVPEQDDPPVADGPAVVDPDGDGPLLAAINAGGPAYESADGMAYQADAGYTGGGEWGSDDPTSGTEDDTLYDTERYGTFTYALPVSGPGTYDLTLMFSEVYWTNAGERLFDVRAGSEGALQTIATELDLWAEVGHDAAYVIDASVTTTDDTLRVSIETLADNGQINALALSEASDTEDDLLTHAIPLISGWNIISSWVAPADDAISDVFGDLSSLMLVEDEQGQLFLPQQGTDDIGTWNPMKSYMVYTSAPDTLYIEGERVTEQASSLPFHEGWNFMPYPYDTAMPVEEMIAPIASDLVLLQDYAGEVYLPGYGINDVGMLKPGQGYKVYLKNSAELPLTPPARVASSQTEQPALAAATSAPQASALSSSAIVMVSAPSLKDGARLTAWTKAGVQVGQGVVRDGAAALAVRGDEAATPDIREGARAGEALVLKHATKDGPQPVPVASVQDLVSGQPAGPALRYRKGALYETAIEQLPGSYGLEANRPNPFAQSTAIWYRLPEDGHVRLDVFDVMGRRVATLANGPQEAGRHQVRFDGSRQAPGVYMVRIQAGDFTETRKMTLVK